VVHATHSGKFLLFAIAPAASAKPAAVSGGMDPSLKTSKDQVSYAAGMRLAKTLRAQSQEVDPDLLAKAMKDVLGGGPTLMSDGQVELALMGVETQLNVTEALLEKRKIAARNKQQGEAFLAANKTKEGVVSLPDGLQYKVIKAGDGKKPTAADVAICQYKGTLVDGTVFDDSHRRKDGGPVHFPLKAVIAGWQEALRMMPAGSRWQIFIPPELGYGERGAPQARIPPNATLIFDVELLSVMGPNEPAQSPKTAGSAPTADVLAAMKKIEQTIEQEKKNP
jgi:FKBP-type peptidyl-prolyl cis-trans isomerase FklB